MMMMMEGGVSCFNYRMLPDRLRENQRIESKKAYKKKEKNKKMTIFLLFFFFFNTNYDKFK